jgi:hypothetical protein
VCSESPCTVSLELGVPVTFSAKSGAREEETVFTPSAQNTSLTIVLKAKSAGGGHRHKGGGGDKAGGESNGAESGLKIPEVFKNN